jgi:hypothetical protein
VKVSHRRCLAGRCSYYNPTSWELVEIEEALKAGHVVEPLNDMQFCASVTEVEDASRPSRNGVFIASVLLFDLIELRLL